MLVTILLLTAAALILSLCLTPLVRLLALKYNLIDLPDNKRKIHSKPIPRVGGIGIVFAYFGACLIIAALAAFNPVAVHPAFAAVRAIAPGLIVIFLTGLADDIFNLKPRQKLVGQIIAAGLVIAGGIRMHGIATFSVHPIVGILGTVAWLVLCTNAVNLIDGVDGLAAGVAFFGTTTVLIASLLCGNFELTMATAPLAGALLGFLVFNSNPASIFLGDCGSLVLGFLLGCFGLIWNENSTSAFGVAAPLMALTVPLLDTSIAITRRFLRARPIFEPDRSHIHHRLLARGLTQRRTVLVLYTSAVVGGALSLCLAGARHPWGAGVLLAFGVAVTFGIRQLKYAEFGTAGRLLLQGGFRREVNAQLALQTFKEKLSASTSPDDCWNILEHASEAFGFRPIGMQFAGQLFHCHPGNHPVQSWAIRIPVSESDWIELDHDFTLTSHSSVVAPFVRTIREVLAQKRTDITRLDKQILTFPGTSYAVTARIS
jgi:UDP-GlcNAc:undecaprenyl-phosphate GlcNAc-1-phosphate transferase